MAQKFYDDSQQEKRIVYGSNAVESAKSWIRKCNGFEEKHIPTVTIALALVFISIGLLLIIFASCVLKEKDWDRYCGQKQVLTTDDDFHALADGPQLQDQRSIVTV